MVTGQAMKARKSWQEKLTDNKGLPKICALEGRMKEKHGTGVMVIPAPMEVKELMDQVPKGKLATINELRAALARKHRATITCPITTGIFVWIASNAAAEAEQNGARKITPYWRTLKRDGELNPRYPGGVPAVQAKLEREGHRVRQRGKRSFVEEFEKRLHSF